MAHVNLLPWREALRNQQKQNYLATLLGVAIAAFAIVWCVGMLVDNQIANQNKRNSFLQQQIAVVDAQIEQIKEIRASKEAIEKRMALIEQLQTSRNVAPIILDELVKILPPGISFKQLSRSGNLMEITGISDSNNRLADFMRRVQESEIFINGELSSIVADGEQNDAVSDFKLTFQISQHIAPEIKTAEEQAAS